MYFKIIFISIFFLSIQAFSQQVIEGTVSLKEYKIIDESFYKDLSEIIFADTSLFN